LEPQSFVPQLRVQGGQIVAFAPEKRQLVGQVLDLDHGGRACLLALSQFLLEVLAAAPIVGELAAQPRDGRC
jgi:hypothetical protein